ncbi:MAG: hypothetical protein WAK85_17570, partial [Xanthobacteraceae bacterium]
ACGVRAGTPDLILIKDGRTYGLELKADNGRVSPAQAQAHAEMKAAAQLERWHLLRGQTQ